MGYSFLNPPGTINETALRNSKAVWNYFTSSFRPKNVPVNILNNNSTQSTLYLLSAAEETSYASAIGTSIKDWDSLAEMVELNTLAFYDTLRLKKQRTESLYFLSMTALIRLHTSFRFGIQIRIIEFIVM